MDKRITFRDMDHSDAIEQHALQKAEKLDKFFKREPLPITVEIILDAHHEHHFFNAEVIVNSKNYHLVVCAQGSDMYAMIDEAIHKMIRNIAHKKEEMGHDLTSHHLN